jgi:uncharacterized protein (DUF58 family)
MLRTTVEPKLQEAQAALGPVVRRVRPVAEVVTTLGWGVLGFGLLCWLLGWRFGWKELMVMATAAWLLMLLCLVLTIGEARLEVVVEVDPQRVTVGAPAAGAVKVRNVSRRPLLPIGLELPIGPGAARFTLPFLGSQAEYEELFVVPTSQRGVVNVGPAMTVRGDPFGLLRRAVAWTEKLEIFVHPITVHLDSLGAGLLRDLEGQTTNDISMSDLNFHALREYQPGDDRRHVHWKSSAKAGKLLVRQFQDTRRSHICVVVDSDAKSYADRDDYELAICAAASITVRTRKDEQEVSVFAGDHAALNAQGSRALDVFARAEFGTKGLHALARHSNRVAPDVSVVFLVTGSETPFQELQRAANDFPIEVRVIGLQVDTSRPTGVRAGRGMTLLSLQRLGDLAALLQGGMR